MYIHTDIFLISHPLGDKEFGDRGDGSQLASQPASQTPAQDWPLVAASYQGHVEVVKLLCDAGAAKDQATNTGATSLYMVWHHTKATLKW